MRSRPEHSERELATAFLAGVSHELRTPLNAVLGMIELSLQEPLSSTVTEYLTTACDSARTLAANLNLMLELAQVDARPLQVDETPLDLQRLTNAAVGRLAPATQRRVTVRIAPGLAVPLYGDNASLERLLATLVEQSARWLENPRIVVQLDGEPVSPDRFLLRIGISEDGLGTRDQRSRLASYDPVETSKYASPGLALAVGRRWLDRIGGSLQTDSPTAGGRFLAEIPLLRKAPQIDPAQPSEHAQAHHQAHSPHNGASTDYVDGFEGPLDVLVVDDTEANQKVVKAVLAKRGHRVEVACNGQQALDRVRRHNFDVVLMDAQMPLMNGFEATAAIRRLPEADHPHVPIIAMTAHALQEDRMRCLAAGMDDYLAKPIDVATLVAHVEYYGHGAGKVSAPDRAAQPQRAAAMPPQDFLAGARARLAGDEALLLELIRLFRQDATSLLERVAAGLRSKDSELASRAAHNLRGLAANFDDARTINSAGAVEKLALEGEFELASAHLDTLRDETSRLIDALTDYERTKSIRDL